MKDIATCSREPIHIPGSIQPHGVLLAFTGAEAMCRHVSANSALMLGREPADLLGRSPEDIFGRGELAAMIRGEGERESPQTLRRNDVLLDAIVHRHEGRTLVELEPGDTGSPARHHRRLQASFATLRAAADLPALYAAAARFIASFTGFERVMVYRFDTDWHGEVVGECLTAEVVSYLGHHFPASDIPEQARALYRRNWLRLIPDADYHPVSLVPPLDPDDGRPLDLSFSTLRSVSPVHLAYLRNMNVRASMSISLLDGGELWGLIACHHRTPLHLPYSTRAACEIFGQFASLEIAAKTQARHLAEQSRAAAIQTRFFDFLAREQNFVDALVKYTPGLLEFMGASGAAVLVNGKATLLGATPGEQAVHDLAAWLEAEKSEPLFVSDRLGEHFAPATAWKDVASGVLAVRLSRVEPHYVLWFRPEVPTTITWAGEPDRAEFPSLHPRASFATWKETINGRSLPWEEAEKQGARELRNAINALVLRRTERLITLNAELERKNTDLNSFAYIASHDLKEPLRGIANYAGFLMEDHGGMLPEEGRHKLRTIRSLAARSEELLDTLNHFSRLGRIEVQRVPVDMDQLVDEVLESLGSALEGVRILRPGPLPTVACDPVLVREVFANLITNAVRYNLRSPKEVTIDAVAGETGPVFRVRDNGIGIREKHHRAIFHIFRRLHAAGDFGDGTGAGLAIAKNIVERHGGRIMVDSTPGNGSIFSLTLA